jgi:rare lipoprotein A (peptidoglycan hydrolase)
MPQQPVEIKWETTGRASYYGRERQGHLTSSGEVFNYHKLTAAHRTLPFGSIVLVTNLQNDKKVKVRINDRGPGFPDRIIDVSAAAARVLGFNGLTDVKVDVLYYGDVEPDYSYLALVCGPRQGGAKPCGSHFVWGYQDPAQTKRETHENIDVARGLVQVPTVRRNVPRPVGNRAGRSVIASLSATSGEVRPLRR